MTILVTGGTGFIGRRLMRRMVQTYHASDILCLIPEGVDSELERTGQAILRELGIRMLPVDLVTGKGMEQVPRSPDLVFHLASDTNTASRDHSINDVGAKNLLNAIMPLTASSRLIFTTTISVSDHRQQKEGPGNEESVLLRPRSEYGRKKLATEALLQQSAREHGYSLTMMRVSATYGEGPRADGLFEVLARLAQRGAWIGRLDYPGRMAMMRVDDLADVLVRLSQQPLDPGHPALYIAHAETMSVHEMCAALYKAAGKPFVPIRMPRWFWNLTRAISQVIYAIEPIVPHGLYNTLWRATLLVDNGYDNVSDRITRLFPDKTFSRFADTAGCTIPDQS